MTRLAERAICLRQWDWSETSQTVLLLTRGHGLVRALAKGSRRPKAPYSGGVEPMSVAQAQILLKPAGALALLTAWDLDRPMLHLRRSLHAWHAAHLAAELTGSLLAELQPHPAAFDALEHALGLLERPEAIDPALAVYMWTLVTEAGFEPRLDEDVERSQPLRAAGTYGFSAALGGLTADDPGNAQLWRVREATVRTLRTIRAHACGAQAEDGPGITGVSTGSDPDLERALSLMVAYCEHVLGLRLRSAENMAWLRRPAAVGAQQGRRGNRP